MGKVIERSGVNPEGTYSPHAINPAAPLDPAGETKQNTRRGARDD
jgi:hypothetical protein